MGNGGFNITDVPWTKNAAGPTARRKLLKKRLSVVPSPTPFGRQPQKCPTTERSAPLQSGVEIGECLNRYR